MRDERRRKKWTQRKRCLFNSTCSFSSDATTTTSHCDHARRELPVTAARLCCTAHCRSSQPVDACTPQRLPLVLSFFSFAPFSSSSSSFVSLSCSFFHLSPSIFHLSSTIHRFSSLCVLISSSIVLLSSFFLSLLMSSFLFLLHPFFCLIY